MDTADTVKRKKMSQKENFYIPATRKHANRKSDHNAGRPELSVCDQISSSICSMSLPTVLGREHSGRPSIRRLIIFRSSSFSVVIPSCLVKHFKFRLLG